MLTKKKNKAQGNELNFVVEGITLSVTMELVTPEMATLWLETMSGNRRVRVRKVDRYAALIRSDRWFVGVGTVVFDAEGCLIDGQHRLRGVMESAQPVHMVVVRGVHPDAKYWIDTGAARTAADAVGMAGVETEQSATATALAFLLRYRRTGYPSSLWKPEHQDLRDGLAEFPDIVDSVDATKAARTSSLYGPHSVFAFCHYLFSRQDSAAADDFFRGVLSGLGVTSETDPRHQLRTRLLEEATKSARMKTTYVIKLIFKAWILWRSGEERVFLRVRTRGDASEGWPEIGIVPGITTETGQD